MAGEPPRFAVVGINDLVWGEYQQWFINRELGVPYEPRDGVFVMDVSRSPGLLIAGCCIYPTDGPWALVEHAAVNPDIPHRLAFEAMVFGARHLAIYGALRRKYMLCFPRTKGIAAVLRRAGFIVQQTPVMTHGPWSEPCL